MTNEKRIISSSTSPTATKLDEVVVHDKESPTIESCETLIMLSYEVTGQTKNVTSLFTTWQDGGLRYKTISHKVTWPFNRMDS